MSLAIFNNPNSFVPNLIGSYGLGFMQGLLFKPDIPYLTRLNNAKHTAFIHATFYTTNTLFDVALSSVFTCENRGTWCETLRKMTASVASFYATNYLDNLSLDITANDLQSKNPLAQAIERANGKIAKTNEEFKQDDTYLNYLKLKQAKTLGPKAIEFINRCEIGLEKLNTEVILQENIPNLAQFMAGQKTNLISMGLNGGIQAARTLFKPDQPSKARLGLDYAIKKTVAKLENK